MTPDCVAHLEPLLGGAGTGRLIVFKSVDAPPVDNECRLVFWLAPSTARTERGPSHHIVSICTFARA